MADYKKMYAVLCGTVDDVIDELETIPCCKPKRYILIPACTLNRNTAPI